MLITPNPALDILKSKDQIMLRLVKKHTALVGIKDFVPEDILWRRDHPRTPSLICFQEDLACECTWNCVPKVAVRAFWLFQHFPDLQQVFIFFQREGEKLRRNRPRVELTAGMAPDYLDTYKVDVPRIYILHIPRNFDSAPRPFRLFMANYDGLQLILKKTEKCFLTPPMSFWSGSF